MSFFDLFRSSSQKKQQNTNTKSLKFETLENREMLSVNSILSQQYTDTVAADTNSAMYLELKSDDDKKWVTVGLIIEAAEDSKLDPSKITVKYQKSSSDSESDDYTYELLPESVIYHQTDGATKSTMIIYVPAGTYQVLIGGDDETTGTFTADVYVPGGTKDSPTSVPQYTPVLVQAGLHQMSNKWNMSMESIYKNLLGTNYRQNISKDYPDLNVTETGRLNQTDATILGLVASSGKVTATLTKSEPEPIEDVLKFSEAKLSTTEKATAFGEPTAAITVTGGSASSLKDYTVTLDSKYTIASSSGGADLSKVELPALVSGTDYKFEDGKFYFNPNGKFNFIPKGTTATLTLSFTATDKTDTTKKGTGTITVTITGANDSPVLDTTPVDITPTSTTKPVEIWTEPWSTTADGKTTTHSDEVALVIDGKNIKIGDTVIKTITDPDVGDTFEFATIGYPAGSVTYENSTWTLWEGEGESKKAFGEIRLSTDKRTLYYKAAGARTDSAFASLTDGELSDKLKFTFTVKDNRGVTSTETTGEKNQKSESGACTVEFQVKRKVDAQMGLAIESTGTTSVSVKAQSVGQDEPRTTIKLPSFFTIDYTGEKLLTYSFDEMTITGSSGVTIPASVVTALKEKLEIYGSNKTDGTIQLSRSGLDAETSALLNSLTDGQSIDVAFKIKVMNSGAESEYVVSETLHIVFTKSTDLVLDNATLSVSQHDADWVFTEPIEIQGGVKQISAIFYDLSFTGNPQITYPSEAGEVENPNLEEGKDYKCEIVVMDQATGKLGVKFSFNPNGKFNFLAVGQDAKVKFFVLLEDAINPILSSTSEWDVTIHGEAKPAAPTFKDKSFSVNENQSLTIEGEDVAESTKTDATLVVDEVRVKIEDVDLLNGTAPNASTAVDGYYVIIKPSSDVQTVKLKSGTLITLDAEGKIKYDPTGRTTKLPEYNESDSTTYADEKITLLVKDTSGTTPVATASAKEYTIRVKGVNQNPAPTFKTIANGDIGSYQNETTTITGADLATSTKTDADLKIKSVSLDADEVVQINGAEPDTSTKVDGRYTITRPTTGETTVKFKSGIVIKLDSTGKLTFDPTGITDAYAPYDLGDVKTYHDEIVKIVVEDVSGTTAVPTATANEVYLRAKGIIYPTFADSVNGFSTPEDKAITIKPSDIASTTKPGGKLVIDEVRVKSDDVELINGAAPGTATDGMYKITRPTTGTQTIKLKSGSLVTLNTDGEITFDPTGRTGDLPPYVSTDNTTYAEEKLTLLVKDIGDTTAIATKTTKEFTILVKGVEESVVPTFKDAATVDLNTTERNPLSIYGRDLANSTKTTAQLVVDEIYLKAENVAKINGAAPTGEPVDGYYKITRPTGVESTITLVSGTVVKLSLSGVVTFDPSGRTGTLPPYDAENPETYADEKLSFKVKDISSDPSTVTATYQEFTVRVKGEPDDEEEPTPEPEDGFQVTGGPFLVNTFATIDEIPDDYAVTPTYKIDDVAIGDDYVFSLVGIKSTFNEADGYFDSTSSPFSLGEDGTILIDKETLVDRHVNMGASNFKTEYYKITVKAVKSGTETELTVEIPLTLKYIAPPQVTTVTTLDGTEINKTAKWQVSKSTDHVVSMEIAVVDANNLGRTDWYTVSEIAMLDWVYGDSFESWTKSEVEADKNAGDEEMTALYTHVASLLDPAGTAFTLALEEQTATGKYKLDFNLKAGDAFNFIGSGKTLELSYEVIVSDDTYHGQTPVHFTIVVQG